MKTMRLYKRGDDYYEATNGLLIINKKAIKMSDMDHKGLVAMGWVEVGLKNQNYVDHSEVAEAVWEYEIEHFSK